MELLPSSPIWVQICVNVEGFEKMSLIHNRFRLNNLNRCRLNNHTESHLGLPVPHVYNKGIDHPVMEQVCSPYLICQGSRC